MGLCEPPEILYKYSAFEGAKAILESGKIKITPPHAFNDPFECLPADFSESISRTILIQKIIEHDEAKDRKGAEEILNNNREKYKAPIEKERNQCVKKYRDYVFDGCGILCLSEACNNILMWSHYADSHQGIVIGFDPKMLYKGDWFKVDYLNNRFQESYIHPSSTGERRRTTIELISTKAELWTYEGEWRRMYELDSLELFVDKNGDPWHFFVFPPEAVKEVIIGAEILPGKREEIVQMLRTNYSHAKSKQANLSKKHFALDITEI